MRYLPTVLILVLLVMATALAQARQAREGRPTARPKEPPQSSLTSSDRSPRPQGARDKARGQIVETIIPDICRGC
jgi:hypothetical protein